MRHPHPKDYAVLVVNVHPFEHCAGVPMQFLLDRQSIALQLQAEQVDPEHCDDVKLFLAHHYFCKPITHPCFRGSGLRVTLECSIFIFFVNTLFDQNLGQPR